MQFIVRTVFIKTLGKDYLGLEELFVNILFFLSLTELGFGHAIVFKLYEPIAKQNIDRIIALMKFYRKVYVSIGCLIVVIGVIIYPFLPYLIKDYHKLQSLNINVAVVFGLYLLRSASSYMFFAYKAAIVRAHQKNYILSSIECFFNIVIGCGQILVLYLFKDFEIYVAAYIIGIILENIAYARVADKMYPYINMDTNESISSAEIKDLFKDCSALFLYKMNYAVVFASGNIIISTFLGLGMVAMYANYFVFFKAIRRLLDKVFTAVVHSVGDLHTTNDVEHEYDVFKILGFLASVLGATAFVGMSLVANEFIYVWIGSKWLLRWEFAIIIGLEMYSTAIKLYLGKYRSAYGLFQQAKFRPIFSMVINLICSLILVHIWGVYGVMAAWLISDVTTFLWMDPLIIHKFGFKNFVSVKEYHFRNLRYFAQSMVPFGLCWFLVNNLFYNTGWSAVVLHSVICAVITPACLLLFNIKSMEAKYLLGIAGKLKKKLR